jgi:predicted GNAT family acetyltransferase
MPSFEHKKPPETYQESGEHVHRLELTENGEKVGYAEFDYRNDPFPFYYISLIFVDREQRQKGFGSEILRKLNKFLDEKGRAGFLINAISYKNPARNMYAEHGWELLPGKEDYYVYNLPKDLEPGRLEKALYQIRRQVLNEDLPKRNAA